MELRKMIINIQQLETEATALARQNRGQLTASLYSTGQAPMTKERAFAQALEADPEVYEAYRAQHNAASVIATLRGAGIIMPSGK